MTFDEQQPWTLAALAAAACDGSITAEQFAQLEQMLQDDPDAVDAYSEQCQFDADLRLVLRSKQSLDRAFDAIRSQIDEQPTNIAPLEELPTTTRTGQFWQRHPVRFRLLIAGVTLLLWASFLKIIVPKNNDHRGPVAGQVESIDSRIAWLVSADQARWEGFVPTSAGIPIDQKLTLRSGTAQLRYATGAQVLLEGPAVYEVLGVNEGYLHRGSLVGQVNVASAKGFTVETPFARVEDQGTEFGIEVDPSGTTDVLVLKGKVDLVRESSGSQPEQRVTLTKDQAASIVAKGGAIERHGKIDVRLAKVMQSRLESMQETAPIFTEDFNSISGSLTASQYDTGFNFGPSIAVSGWTSGGGNATHVVNLTGGNCAPMIFNGNTGFAPNSLTLTRGIAANDSGVTYEVSFLVSPTIGGIATSGTDDDGLVIEVLRSDQSVLAAYNTAQKTWTGAHGLQSESFTYLGDGTGRITFRIRSQKTLTSDHAGVIDDLSVRVREIPEPASKPE